MNHTVHDLMYECAYESSLGCDINTPVNIFIDDTFIGETIGSIYLDDN